MHCDVAHTGHALPRRGAHALIHINTPERAVSRRSRGGPFRYFKPTSKETLC